jgi:hypothetical protein
MFGALCCLPRTSPLFARTLRSSNSSSAAGPRLLFILWTRSRFLRSRRAILNFGAWFRVPDTSIAPAVSRNEFAEIVGEDAERKPSEPRLESQGMSTYRSSFMTTSITSQSRVLLQKLPHQMMCIRTPRTCTGEQGVIPTSVMQANRRQTRSLHNHGYY